MRLNLGCGNKKGSGYIGIDVVRESEADIIADIEHLPLRPKCASLVKIVCVFEHLKRPDKALDEIKRVLIRGGSLICGLSTETLNPIMFNAKHFLFNFPISLLYLKKYALYSWFTHKRKPVYFHYWKLTPAFFRGFKLVMKAPYGQEHVYRALRVGRKSKFFKWLHTPIWTKQTLFLMKYISSGEEKH